MATGTNDQWDLTTDGKFTRHSEHSIAFSLDDFGLCETEEQVLDTSRDLLAEYVAERLV